jgi:hypothetical protein
MKKKRLSAMGFGDNEISVDYIKHQPFKKGL